jgi:purine-cytosine permease-like protein
MATKLPQLTKKPLVNKSIWLGVFTTVAAALGLGLVGLVNLSGGLAVLVSGTFIVTLLVAFVFGVVYDYMTPAKKIYYSQNAMGAFVMAIALPLVLSLLGINSLPTLTSLASFATVGVFVAAVATEYVGFWAARKLKL